MKIKYWLPAALAGACIYAVFVIRQQPYDNVADLRHIPTFSPAVLAFEHQYKSADSLPFAGATIIDIENDGVPEVFIGGGYLQRDGLFAFGDGQFENISPDRGLGKDIGDATYAAASIDVNRDGRVDLFVGRDSGLYLYYNQNGFFVQRRVSADLGEHEVPVSIALGDINRDDRVDLFVSCLPRPAHLGPLLFAPAGKRASGRLLLNRGDNRFEDITESAGVAHPHGSFSALFAELNADRWLDLVVTYHQAPAVIYENIDGRRFQARPYPGSEVTGFSTGAAASDINNDGLTDLLLTGTGSSIPDFLMYAEAHANTRTRWSLLRNEGGFNFTEIADQARVAGYELAWGAAFADFNLDGRQDIAAAQNLHGWPPQWLYKNPGRLLIHKNDNTFAATESTAGARNRRYGVSPLVADFNNDGYPDLVWVNVGGPAAALINNGGNARYLKIDLGDNPAALGAKIRLQASNKQTLNGQQIAETGVGADQSPVRIFGVGPQAQVDSVAIDYLSGKTLVLDRPPLNRTLDFKGEIAEIPAEPPPDPTASDAAPAATEKTRPAAEPLQGETVAPVENQQPETSVEDELEQLLTE